MPSADLGKDAYLDGLFNLLIVGKNLKIFVHTQIPNLKGIPNERDIFHCRDVKYDCFHNSCYKLS